MGRQQSLFDQMGITPISDPSAKNRRFTDYAQVRPLFADSEMRPLLPVGEVWADPFAGDGRMVELVQRACAEFDLRPQRHWQLCDIVDDKTLRGRATDGEVLVTVGDMYSALAPNPWVRCVFTNFPWFGWSWDAKQGRSLLERTRELYPSAIILGLSDQAEEMDRSEWFRANRPSYICKLNGRQAFALPGEETMGTKYRGIIAWYVWLAGVECAKRTETIWLE